MMDNVFESHIKGVIPTASGCAVFLSSQEKIFVIYVDPFLGNCISMAINHEKRDRPMTHDLITMILQGLDAKIQHVVISDVSENTFFATIMLTMKNEVHTKFVEMDARPSDAMILALKNQKTIYVHKTVLDQVEDMTDVFEKLMSKDD
jgi:bifunctional DNase/RNase